MKRENGGISQANNPIKKASANIKVNDIGFRLILIPFFGIVIPSITGLIDHTKLSNWDIKLGYLYNIGIAFIIWHGNRYLLFTLRSYFDWFNKPLRKVIALLLIIPFFTIISSVLLMVGWYHIFEDGNPDWNIITYSTLIVVIAVLFITQVYETVFLVKEAESEKVQLANIEKAKAEAELEALKNQIDPHFIFNSLNTLSHLIEDNPAKAKQFNDNLADVYRYILQNKARGLVLLREEIDFLKDYFSLLKIRFEEAVQLKLVIKEEILDKYLIPPISLQVLAENAIKHNEFSLANPLYIDIHFINEELVIHNNMKKKKLRKASSKIGLQNLNDRYLLTTNNVIRVTENNNDFTVNLPVLKIA